MKYYGYILFIFIAGMVAQMHLGSLMDAGIDYESSWLEFAFAIMYAAFLSLLAKEAMKHE